MCKYCELEFIPETGEKTNNVVTVMTIKDGNRIIDLWMNRYIDEERDVRNNELIINDGIVALYGDVYSVNEKHINIEYCPFCGEKL